MRRQQSYTVYLDPEQIEQLRALSKVKGVAFTALVREAIDLVLERHAHRMEAA